MPQWRRVAKATDIREGEPLVIELAEDESALLTRVNGRVTACGSTCPHYGGPLGDGVIEDGRVVCPYHNATFTLQDGRLDRTPALDDLPTYEVKEEDGSVFIGEKREPEIGMPSQREDRSIVIVGAGAAGAACAEELRRIGFGGTITMLTADSEAPYDRPMLSKGLLSGDAPAKYLPLRPNSFYKRLGITVLTGSRVARVDAAERSVTTNDDTRHAGDMLLLATGGVPKRLQIPGAHAEGVFTLRTHADATAIMEAAEDASSVAIVGGSFIGMECAAQLRSRGLDVTVLEAAGEPLSIALGPEIGGWMRALHEQEGVRFRLRAAVKEIAARDGRAHGVVLQDDERVEADLVIMGVGVEPRVDYLAQSGLVDGDGRNGVRVDERLMTSAPGVYAAGDIAVYPAWDEEYRVEHWVHAQAQGRHVAHAMLGSNEPFRRVPFFWTRQFGTAVKYAGFPGSWDHIQYDGVPGDGEFIAGFFSGTRLLAVAGSGKARKFTRLARMLEEGERLNREEFLGVRDAPGAPGVA